MIKGNKIFAIVNPSPGWYEIRPAIYVQDKIDKEYCGCWVEDSNGTIHFEQCRFALTLEDAKRIAKDLLIEWKMKEIERIKREEVKVNNIRFDVVEAYYDSRKKSFNK